MFSFYWLLNLFETVSQVIMKTTYSKDSYKSATCINWYVHAKTPAQLLCTYKISSANTEQLEAAEL